MRCSSCEPLLDAYLELVLPPRRASGVAVHLRECAHCRTLLGELRVVDALLTTAQIRGEVPADFTAGVVSAARATPPPLRRKRLPLWGALALYLSIAWLVAALAQLESHGATKLLGGLVDWQHRGVAAIGAVIHAMAPLTPIAAATVTFILVLDLLLLGMLLLGYHHARPLIAYHLAKGEPKP